MEREKHGVSVGHHKQSMVTVQFPACRTRILLLPVLSKPVTFQGKQGCRELGRSK